MELKYTHSIKLNERRENTSYGYTLGKTHYYNSVAAASVWMATTSCIRKTALDGVDEDRILKRGSNSLLVVELLIN